MEALGEDVGELVRGVNTDQTKVTILNRFMCEVLPKVDVLSTLTSPDDVVAPFDARVVVFIDGRVSLLLETHVLEERTEVDDFYRCRRCCVVLGLGSRERDSLCNFVFQWIGAPLYRRIFPVVERRELLFPQSAWQ